MRDERDRGWLDDLDKIVTVVIEDMDCCACCRIH